VAGRWWGVIAIVIGLLGGAVVSSPALAQNGQPGTLPNTTKHQEGALLALGQNYPNPFSPTTRIPFAVGDAPACSNPGRHYRVSLKIYNLLAQLVAVPVMADAPGSSAPLGQPVEALDLPCGQYTAFWDGTGVLTNRAVAPGLYLYRLEVNGKAVAARKMLIQR
jgi:hypothetical protein